MTWPGLIRKQPYRGLTAWLPRDHYNPGDPHAGRPAVVVKVLQVEKACFVVTRTSQHTVNHRGDIYHEADPKLPCCDRPGWWQPGRAYRVGFAAWDDEETGEFATMENTLLNRIIEAYERRS